MKKWLRNLLGIEMNLYRVCQECRVLFAHDENLKYDNWCAAHRQAQIEKIELENWGINWVKRNLDKIKEFKRQEEAEQNKMNQTILEQLAKMQADAQAAQCGSGMQGGAYWNNSRPLGL